MSTACRSPGWAGQGRSGLLPDVPAVRLRCTDIRLGHRLAHRLASQGANHTTGDWPIDSGFLSGTTRCEPHPDHWPAMGHILICAHAAVPALFRHGSRIYRPATLTTLTTRTPSSNWFTAGDTPAPPVPAAGPDEAASGESRDPGEPCGPGEAEQLLGSHVIQQAEDGHWVSQACPPSTDTEHRGGGMPLGVPICDRTLRTLCYLLSV